MLEQIGSLRETKILTIRVSSFRQDRRQIYARVSPPGPNRHMAAVPDAACIEHVGLRLFLRPDGPVPDASRLLRHPAREQGGSPRCRDAASDSGLGRAANRRMLRLGSSATAILDPRSRQPLWRELRSSRPGSRNTPSSDAVQVTPSQCCRGEMGEICAMGMFGPSRCFSEANLRRVLSAYVTYYNRWRPHRSLGQAAPCGEARPFPRQACPKIAAEPVLRRVTPHLPRRCMTSFCAPQACIPYASAAR
jgi:hypothetical protein